MKNFFLLFIVGLVGLFLIGNVTSCKQKTNEAAGSVEGVAPASEEELSPHEGETGLAEEESPSGSEEVTMTEEDIPPEDLGHPPEEEGEDNSNKGSE